MQKTVSRIGADGQRETVTVEMTAEERAALEAFHAENAPSAVDVKAEARRRILARLPEWKQANLTARGVELLRKGEASWTAQELAEADGIHAVWDWVKSVRLASDAIEATSPIPEDFRADRYWPG